MSCASCQPICRINRVSTLPDRQSGGSGMQFQDLVDLVSLAADTANGTMYSKVAMSQSRHGTRPECSVLSYQGEAEGKQSSGSFATSVNSPAGGDTTCPMCRKLHDLDACKSFLAKSIDDRRAFLKENRMCFSCYGLNHLFKGCTKKRKCQKCSKRHPAALRIDGFNL